MVSFRKIQYVRKNQHMTVILISALIEKKGKYSALNVTSLKQNNRLEINQARLLVNQGATWLGH